MKFRTSIFLSALLVVCMGCQTDTITKNNTGVDSTTSLSLYYILYHDSLFTDHVVLENGVDPDTGSVYSLPGVNPYTYNYRDVPEKCWVQKWDFENGIYEECSLFAETLYCPSDTDFINWLVACPNSEF